jgi:lipopolysaccharide/colanic/teichoic acid biosynthesis glycosyltransferase
MESGRVPPTEDHEIGRIGQARGAYPNVVKPVIDRVGATLLLLAAAPWMLLIAVAVAVGHRPPDHLPAGARRPERQAVHGL